MKRRPPTLRAILLIAAGTLALAMVGGMFIVRALLTPERLRTETVRVLGEATGEPVELAAARLSYVPLGVFLQDLRIGPAAEPQLALPSGLAQLEVWPLLRGRIILNRIVLENPAVILRAAPAKAGGASSPPAAAARALDGAVEELDIRGGTFRWISPEDGNDFSLGGIDLKAAVQFDAGGVRTDGTLSLRGLDLPALAAYAETMKSLEPEIRFLIEYATADDRVSLKTLTLNAPPLALSASGEIRSLSSHPVLSLVLDSPEQTLESLLPIIPPDLLPSDELQVAGAVALAASLEAPLDTPEVAPTVHWNIALRDLSVMRGSTRVLSGVVGRLAGTADSVRVQELRGTLGENGTVDASGTVFPTEDLRIRAELEIADLVRAGVTPEGLEAAGRVELDVQSKAQVLSGPVRIRNASFDGPDLVAPGSDWNLEAELEGADLRIDRLTGKIGRSRLDLSGRVTSLREGPSVSLNGRSAHLDLVELSARTEAKRIQAGAGSPPPPLIPVFPDLPTTIYLAADTVTVEGARWTQTTLRAVGRADSGSVHAEIGTANYDGLVLKSFQTDLALRGQTARGSFRTPEVNAYGSALRTVTGTIDLTGDRVLHLKDMAGQAWQGSVTGAADIDLADPDQPGFDIRTKATGLQADAFLSSVVSARNIIQGTLDLESSFTGKGAEPAEILKALTGNGSFHATNGKIAHTPFVATVWKTLHLGEKDSLPFRDLVTLFRVANGRILSDAIRLEGADAVWDVSGSIGLDGSLDYRVRTTLNESLSNTFRQRVGTDLATLLAGTSGPLALDLDVKGPAASPEVKIDRAALAARVGGTVKETVKETVKDKVTDKVSGGLKGLLGGDAKSAPPDSGG